MNNQLIPSVNPPTAKIEPAWWFVFIVNNMMVIEEEESINIPFVRDLNDLGLRPTREWYLGTINGNHCYCAEVSENDSFPEKMVLYGLRYLYGRLENTHHKIGMKAVHMIDWDRTVRFCSRCGTEMNRAKGMNAKECPDCGFLSFPRISPAVIVLIERENKVLLVRSKRFTTELYSVLAGFVEPGETLEETVTREVEEEVGIRIKNIRYFGSQPWPFPDSLMIGFTAEYESGEIRIEEDEIADAGWFDPEKLPTIPGKISIARELIDWFVEVKSREKGIVVSKKERRYNSDE
jgi:NAD+ diphosphatase